MNDENKYCLHSSLWVKTMNPRLGDCNCAILLRGCGPQHINTQLQSPRARAHSFNRSLSLQNILYITGWAGWAVNKFRLLGGKNNLLGSRWTNAHPFIFVQDGIFVFAIIYSYSFCFFLRQQKLSNINSRKIKVGNIFVNSVDCRNVDSFEFFISNPSLLLYRVSSIMVWTHQLNLRSVAVVYLWWISSG